MRTGLRLLFHGFVPDAGSRGICLFGLYAGRRNSRGTRIRRDTIRGAERKLRRIPPVSHAIIKTSGN